MDSIFGIGFPELVTIFILAGIIMGPERIGRVARWLGRTTAQLQAIARGFMRQLTAELESADSGGDLKGAVQDIQDLQRQLAELRGELRNQATSVLKEGKTALKEVENTIKPPTLSEPTVPKKSTDDEKSGSENGTTSSVDLPSDAKLPNVVDIPDDTE
jgi:Sec-independent protein translocase protein TatA